MNEALVNSMPFAASLGLEITRAEAEVVEGSLLDPNADGAVSATDPGMRKTPTLKGPN